MRYFTPHILNIHNNKQVVTPCLQLIALIYKTNFTSCILLTTAKSSKENGRKYIAHVSTICRVLYDS